MSEFGKNAIIKDNKHGIDAGDAIDTAADNIISNVNLSRNTASQTWNSKMPNINDNNQP